MKELWEGKGAEGEEGGEGGVLGEAAAMDTETIVQRIVDNRLKYVKRNKPRVAKEENYAANDKAFVEEG